MKIKKILQVIWKIAKVITVLPTVIDSIKDNLKKKDNE